MKGKGVWKFPYPCTKKKVNPSFRGEKCPKKGLTVGRLRGQIYYQGRYKWSKTKTHVVIKGSFQL